MWDYFYLEGQKNAAPFIRRAKVEELVSESIPVLEMQFNRGEKLEYISVAILNYALNEFAATVFIQLNGKSYGFTDLKTLCMSKIPTLERMMELPFWKELQHLEQQRLMDFFEQRPLFKKKVINRLYKHLPSN